MQIGCESLLLLLLSEISIKAKDRTAPQMQPLELQVGSIKGHKPSPRRYTHKHVHTHTSLYIY